MDYIYEAFLKKNSIYETFKVNMSIHFQIILGKLIESVVDRQLKAIPGVRSFSKLLQLSSPNRLVFSIEAAL